MITFMKLNTIDDRPLISVTLEGKVVYGDPMTVDEIKKTMSTIIAGGNNAEAAAIGVNMLFASELSRLSKENEELRKQLDGAPKWCPGCGMELRGGLHVCGGRGGASAAGEVTITPGSSS